MKNQEVQFLVNGVMTTGVIIDAEKEWEWIDGEEISVGLIYTVLCEDFVTTHKIHETDVLSVNIYY